PIALIVWDTEFRVKNWNPAAEKIFGFTQEEMMGKHPYGLIVPGEAQPQVDDIWSSLLEGDLTAHSINENVTKDGRTIICDWTNTPLKEADGTVTGVLSMTRDITERKRTQEELQWNYNTQNALNAILKLAVEDNSLDEFLNRSLKLLVSIPWLALESKGCIFVVKDEPDALIMKAQINLADSLLKECTRIPFGKCLCGKAALTGEVIFRDSLDESHEIRYQDIQPHGHYCVPIQASGKTIGLLNLYVKEGHQREAKEEEFLIHIANTLAGIIQQLSAEDALAESEERYRVVFERAGDYVLMLDIEQGEIPIIMDANEAALVIHGYSRDDIIGKPITLFDPEMTPEMLIERKQLLDSEGGGVISARHYRQDGTVFDVEAHIQLVPIGEKMVLLSIERDVTERKRAEESLRDSEARYRALFEGSADGILIADIETKKFVFANPTICRMLGYSESELLELNVSDIHPREALELVISEFEDQERGENTLAPNIPCLRKDRKIIYVDINTSMVMIGGRACNVGFFNDVTERRRLEEQLAQSQKMEGIGRLAGGIAHDFNNLLTVIAGHVDMAILQVKPQDPLHSDLNEILRASNRAADLTRQLLAFSRKQILEVKVINLNDVISNLDKMLSRIIGEDVDLKIMQEKELWNVKADPGQIEQVIINLAVNARDAMSEGGKLTIETLNVQLDSVYSQTHHEVISGEYVLLAVSDNGCGISEEVRAKIFEPFFTTKEVGQGTGLGLSTVYGIVRQSLGHIFVYSELDRGTAFKLYFPRSLEAAEPIDKAASPRPGEELRGSETILVVEDEPTVRDMAVKILRRYGYKVIDAATGGDAILLCEQMKVPVDLALTDVIMPNMSGAVFVERLRKIWPDVKVLYMSGYTANAIVHHGILDEGTPFLPKPFRPMDLLRKVKQIISE
ncbi:MAG: PAS domain S-box protein, partial [Calditrichota bacterium]